MIKRIRELRTLPDYKLFAAFDDGRQVIYDMQEDIRTPEVYSRTDSCSGCVRQGLKKKTSRYSGTQWCRLTTEVSASVRQQLPREYYTERKNTDFRREN